MPAFEEQHALKFMFYSVLWLYILSFDTVTIT